MARTRVQEQRGPGLERELEISERDEQAARRELARLTERLAQQSAELARTRRLEQTVSALTVALRETRGDIERTLGSRAWRLGHFTTRTLSRVAGREVRTEGALVAALARIARVQQATHIDLAGRGGAGGAPAAAPRPSATPLSAPAQRRASRAQALARTRSRAALAGELRARLGPPPQRPHWPSVSVIVPTRDGREDLERLLAGLTDFTDYPALALEVLVVDNASSDDTLAYLARVQTPFALRVLDAGENLSYAQANARGVQQASGELLLFANNDVEPFEEGWLKELVCALQGEGVGAAGATLVHGEERTGPGGEPLLQHRAIRFRWEQNTIRAFNAGDGESLWGATFGADLGAPAVTGACMLTRRETYARVGGFGADYQYGTEDVDLGLKLLLAGLRSTGAGRSVLIHNESSSQNRAGRDFRRLNREENRRLFLENWGPRVLREYRLARLRCDPFWTDGAGAHIAITLTSLDVTDGWGDWYSGHEIGDALEQLGWRVTYVERRGDRWYELPEDLDYLLALMDSYDLSRVPPHVGTIAWIRNWTERWLERSWFQDADVLLASSQRSAELIEERTGRCVELFPLAVNPERFHPRQAEERFRADYAFTGNRWGKDRDIQHALSPRAAERVAIYGKGWEEVPGCAPYACGELPYDELALLYPSVKLVLDDTQGPTLPYGAVNARVFDALAAGTLVLTNCESGVRELFDEDFPVWSSRETLRARLDELLGDDRRRAALAARYRQMVLERHTYGHRATRLRELLIEHEQRLTFCLKIGAPNREVAPRWGDLHFAEALARELRRRGHRTLIQTLEEWEAQDGLLYDVVIHLKGLSRYHPRPGQFNVLWSISHPAELAGDECDGYDLVAVASPTFAARLQEWTSTPVVVLEQAADPRVMYPDPRDALAHELVYVANSRNVLRPVARELLPTEHDLAIWGANWEGLIDTSYVIADHVPNAALRQVYSSAGVVLNDHWEDMRSYGYISNRVYDALACGALVLSDEVPGLAERFGEAVVCYGSGEELREWVERLLADPAERRRRAELGRSIVLEGHTFAHRVDALLAAVEQRIRPDAGAHRLRAAA